MVHGTILVLFKAIDYVGFRWNIWFINWTLWLIFFSVCFQLIVATEHWKALSDQEYGLLLQDGQSSKLPMVKKKDEKKN